MVGRMEGNMEIRKEGKKEGRILDGWRKKGRKKESLIFFFLCRPYVVSMSSLCRLY